MQSKTLAKMNQYLTFNLNTELFGLNVSTIREILEFTKITKIPQMPDYMIGIINLRGKVVPVIDLRAKFGMDRIEETIESCIIVVEISVETAATFGLLVDNVQEVIDIPENEILPPPKIGNKLKKNFIEGMSNQADHFVILLNIDEIFTHDEIELVIESSDFPADTILET